MVRVCASTSRVPLAAGQRQRARVMANRGRKRRISSVSIWLARLKRREHNDRANSLALAAGSANGGSAGIGASPSGGELVAGGAVLEPNPLAIAAATAGVYVASLF